MKKISILVMAFLLCLSCASVEKTSEKNVQQTPKPVDISSPVIPQLEKAKVMEAEKPKELFTFSLREADIKDVLRAISKQTGYNVIMEPDVKGVCTVDLKDVTLIKALEYILEPLNYVFKIEDRTVYVSKPKIETRFFPLNYVTLTKLGKSTVTGSSTGQATSGTGSGQQTTGASAALINLQTVSEADLWKTLEDNIKIFLSPEGRYAINRHASIVMVMDYMKNIKNVAMFLEAIEGTVQRQVMIEAKIVEVTLTEETRDGINWSALGTKWLGSEFNINIEQALVSPQTRYFNIPRIYDTFDPTKFPTPPTNYFRFGVSKGKFDSFIDLLKTVYKVNFISTPKISTLNNQRAVIKVAKDDVYFDYSSTTGTSTTTSGFTTKFVTVGLILDVTPQIDNQGNILMNIHPVLTDKVSQVEMPTPAGTTGAKAYVPILAVREVDTIVKVREGETVIIAGLIQNKSLVTETGVKDVSDIPIIGRLFKQKETDIQKTELVIFLTPKIVYGKESL
ncbi:MAG TPA: secretin N-terminal domain-containing protein [Syntrophorhabdaceae bacterium]|nr:secretin N-terminal domain-containing protein [Syntrophorhabdaceae bacterium]HPC67245.1 secretin N-terminal domain-containing protein [Syntrophorhabdaceae bacterium]HQE80415.1 secretin N-terminal domain-containing protein [Syntrophorhabdaceae bacterium]HQH43634.1 secretin N-terminal domain-containing protein [Syntrophorhabdaceae bacterium]HQK46949.1 secretin N-terminal domain-containing protein [Syntrophorhabdaceae bacterium]